ncbi:MAG: 3-dehydroquinate synthase [Eubacterium sp.]|nr:3-dehydroquinate synthase [Eubacterium sp.]MBR4241247.1 3-dehydroquinate synthase [Eubacterium sp.]
MKKVSVNAGKGYEILIEEGILPYCGSYIKKIKPAKKVCVISDTNVYKLYGKTVKESLQKSGFEIIEFVFKAGEESKTTKTVVSMVEFMAENEMTREDLVVALGGGVCGDMAGFASAIYLRGIDFVQIPTSLLAQVDSSVGGKTAVDLPQGKNLCGAFHQPILVLIDPCTLKSLSTGYFSDGMAEAIKMGCIKSASLFEKIAKNNLKEDLIDIIYECVALKAGVVERDEKEHGERALLNFGHTAGHAIEKLHNFSGISHGAAVGIGMLLICEAAERNGLTKKGCKSRIEEVLKTYNLPTGVDDSLSDIVSSMNADKKRTGKDIKFIMIKDIGEGFINPIEYKEIERFFGV